MTTDKLHIKGFDLETLLAYSIAPTLPLLALGRPGEHLGAVGFKPPMSTGRKKSCA